MAHTISLDCLIQFNLKDNTSLEFLKIRMWVSDVCGYAKKVYFHQHPHPHPVHAGVGEVGEG